MTLTKVKSVTVASTKARRITNEPGRHQVILLVTSPIGHHLADLRSSLRRLQELAAYRMDDDEMLTHLLISQIPKYNYTEDDRHCWDEDLMDHSGLTTRRRAAKDSKKISLWVTSTAWNKLHCHRRR